MEIKNLKAAAQRIKKAVEAKEEIIIYSDADLDGTASLLILEEAIKNLGGKVSAVYFPCREKDGYGLHKEALASFKKYSPALLLLLDCGITNFRELDIANEMAFETIIIDHHEITEKLPAASIIVDPKQAGDKYPFKFLAACGLVFKLSKELLKQRLSGSLEQSFLELVALATIADKMPMSEDNKILVEQGLSYLPFTSRPGLKALVSRFDEQNWRPAELAEKLCHLLQITEVKNHLTQSYVLLSASDEKKIREVADELFRRTAERKNRVKALYMQIEEDISSDTEPFILEGGEEFPLSLTGILASRLCNKFKKPTFIYVVQGELIRGSSRAPSDINTVELLKHCAGFLETYGGHPPASGFTLKKDMLEQFRDCLRSYFNIKGS